MDSKSAFRVAEIIMFLGAALTIASYYFSWATVCAGGVTFHITAGDFFNLNVAGFQKYLPTTTHLLGISILLMATIGFVREDYTQSCDLMSSVFAIIALVTCILTTDCKIYETYNLDYGIHLAALGTIICFIVGIVRILPYIIKNMYSRYFH